MFHWQQEKPVKYVLLSHSINEKNISFLFVNRNKKFTEPSEGTMSAGLQQSLYRYETLIVRVDDENATSNVL
jgi:hypothetical protein